MTVIASISLDADRAAQCARLGIDASDLYEIARQSRATITAFYHERATREPLPAVPDALENLVAADLVLVGYALARGEFDPGASDGTPP